MVVSLQNVNKLFIVAQGHLMNIHSAPDLVMLGLEKACFLQKNNGFS
jgi:hypothetical protein